MVNMEFTDSLWKEKWSVTKYNPIVGGQIGGWWGDDQEPNSSRWMASLSEAMGDGFKEGVCVLDYGCGCARYANFLSERLEDFTYYGLEMNVDNGKESCGVNAIKLAQSYFGKDKRIHLGFIEDEIEKEAFEKCDIILLGSVFTHIPIEEIEKINKKCMGTIDRGGIVVFSIFLGSEYKPGIKGIYGIDDCYRTVHYTKEQLKEMYQGLICEQKGEYCSKDITHLIFRVKKT